MMFGSHFFGNGDPSWIITQFGSFCDNLFDVMPLVKCPTCAKMNEYTGNEYRPFCSERCQLIDFGAWANEEFSLPAQGEPLSEEDLHEIEKAQEKENSL